jgi:hypothetical protein
LVGFCNPLLATVMDDSEQQQVVSFSVAAFVWVLEPLFLQHSHILALMPQMLGSAAFDS